MANYKSFNEALIDHVVLDASRVIDVGSGAGGLVRWLRSQGADAVGVEAGPVMREMAFEADPDHPESYVDAVGQDLPFEDATADAVVFSYSLHHVPEDEMVTALREAHRVLRTNGTLLVVEPVAAGPGFEAGRLIDDETHVRAMAQDALDHAGELGFEPVMAQRYVTQATHKDAEAWEKRMVGIDPGRAQAMEEHRAEAHERFYANATKTDDGYHFDQVNDLKVYRKR